MSKSMRDSVNKQLGEAFGTVIPYEAPTVIKDMLEWQTMMDNAPASINMRGTKRLFDTISHYLARDIFINESPDPTVIVIPLTDTVGVQISTSVVDCFDINPETNEEKIEYLGQLDIRFVDLTGKEWYTA